MTSSQRWLIAGAPRAPVRTRPMNLSPWQPLSYSPLAGCNRSIHQDVSKSSDLYLLSCCCLVILNLCLSSSSLFQRRDVADTHTHTDLWLTVDRCGKINRCLLLFVDHDVEARRVQAVPSGMEKPQVGDSKHLAPTNLLSWRLHSLKCVISWFCLLGYCFILNVL